MIVYLETSAAVKILFVEAESAGMAAYLAHVASEGHSVVSSALLETELRRTAIGEASPQASVTSLLDRLDLFDVARPIYTAAGVLPGANLRSLDALHIAAALHIGADLMVSYDRRQIEAAEACGLRTVSP